MQNIILEVKNVMCQPVIWWCIILRCGRINPGIQEYNEDYIMQWEPQDSLLLQIRITVTESARACSYYVFKLAGTQNGASIVVQWQISAVQFCLYTFKIFNS